MEPTRVLKNDEEVDRISNLPEAIVHQILSFLDMKYVVQTSVLSRRWRYVWTFLPFLNFNDSAITRFQAFVDRVLLLRESCSNIHSFRLSCGWHNYDVYTWILKALRLNVVELILDLDDEYDDTFHCQLPSCLLTCKSLTIFELSASSVKLSLHDSMSLPCLKTLLLEGVWLEGYDIHNKICTSCPVLESLTLSHCKFDVTHQTDLNISAPKLKHLVIEDNYGMYNSSYCEDYSIKLYAPNLISFRINDCITTYSIGFLSSLVRADIGTGDGFAELDEEGAKWMFNFLRGLHNVEDLKLSGYFLEAVSGVRAVLESKPILFGNLRCLKVGRCDFSSDCVNAITYLLTISPNIESLLLQLFERTVHCGWESKYPYLDEVKTNSPEIEAFYKDAGLLTHCTLHHLKSVEIRGIQGRLNEFMFLEFLLKNSPVLKNMVQSLPRVSGKESTHTKSKVVKFTKQLQSLPRVSSCITILLL